MLTKDHHTYPGLLHTMDLILDLWYQLTDFSAHSSWINLSRYELIKFLHSKIRIYLWWQFFKNMYIILSLSPSLNCIWLLKLDCNILDAELSLLLLLQKYLLCSAIASSLLLASSEQIYCQSCLSEYETNSREHSPKGKNHCMADLLFF